MPAIGPVSKAGPAYPQWSVISSADSLDHKDAENCPAGDIGLCIRFAEQRGYGGFAVFDGTAYFRKAPTLECLQGLHGGDDTIFYLRLPSDSPELARGIEAKKTGRQSWEDASLAKSPKRQMTSPLAQLAQSISPSVLSQGSSLLEFQNFQRLPVSEHRQFLKNLNPHWPGWKPPGTHRLDLKKLSNLIREVESMTWNMEVSYVQLMVKYVGKSMVFLNRPTPSGLPFLHQVTMVMADNIFKNFRPFLEKYGFRKDLAGYAEMDEEIWSQMDNLPDDMVRSWSTAWYNLVIGARPSRDAQFFAFGKMILDGLSNAAQGMIGTGSSFFLRHLALPPLERSQHSAARTIAFVEAMLLSLLRSSGTYKRVIWVPGATMSEVQFARAGLFEDAVAWLAGGHDIGVTPMMEIHLIGDNLDDSGVPGSTGHCSKQVIVHWHSWDELYAGALPDPSLVFCFNTGIGTLDPSIAQKWLPLLIDFLGYEVKSPMPNQQGGVPLVLTCRCEEEAQGEFHLLNRLGARSFVPATSKQHMRNMYSSMAGNPHMKYDENGWFIVVNGSKLKPEALLAMANEAETLCKEVQEAGIAWPTPGPSSPKRKKGALEKTAPEEPSSPKKTQATGEPDEAAQAIGEEDNKKTVVFWGILDLKYDPTQELGHRVKVLETGDGRHSKFSGAGAAIKESFNKENKMAEEGIHREVMVECKKLTHDMISESGYDHVQPKQACYPKMYHAKLAQDIKNDLGLTDDDICVLKLSNRARGAGVVPLHVSTLDESLKLMLNPPRNLKAWFASLDPMETRLISWGCFEEQVRHFWSNEYPCFLVEEFCLSQPLTEEIDGRICEFDGTMRVGFVLYRGRSINIPEGWRYGRDGHLSFTGEFDGEQALHTVSEVERMLDPMINIFPDTSSILQIQWLGGYWKLPLNDSESPDLRGRIVSVAKKGTAPVATAGLHEVYAALGDFTSQIFQRSDKISPVNLLKSYADVPEYASYVIARTACSLRSREPHKSNQLMGLAKSKVEKLTGLARDLTMSYIKRHLGVQEAIAGRWDAARDFWQESLQVMPSNATARYLLGLYHLEMGETKLAIDWMEESLHLDPDYRAPYCNIGVAWLQLSRYDKAAEVSKAGLARHPQSSHCLFNHGTACFALAVVYEARKAKEAEQLEKAISELCRGIGRDMASEDLVKKLEECMRFGDGFLPEDSKTLQKGREILKGQQAKLLRLQGKADDLRPASGINADGSEQHLLEESGSKEKGTNDEEATAPSKNDTGSSMEDLLAVSVSEPPSPTEENAADAAPAPLAEWQQFILSKCSGIHVIPRTVALRVGKEGASATDLDSPRKVDRAAPVQTGVTPLALLATDLRNQSKNAFGSLKLSAVPSHIWTHQQERMLLQMERTTEPLFWAMDKLPNDGWRASHWRA